MVNVNINNIFYSDIELIDIVFFNFNHSNKHDLWIESNNTIFIDRQKLFRINSIENNIEHLKYLTTLPDFVSEDKKPKRLKIIENLTVLYCSFKLVQKLNKNKIIDIEFLSNLCQTTNNDFFIIYDGPESIININDKLLIMPFILGKNDIFVCFKNFITNYLLDYDQFYFKNPIDKTLIIYDNNHYNIDILDLKIDIFFKKLTNILKYLDKPIINFVYLVKLYLDNNKNRYGNNKSGI